MKQQPVDIDMDFRRDNDIVEWLLSGKSINRPLKEWERRAVQRKIMHLRANAAEREDFAFRTTSDKSARTAEAGAKAMRMKADQLESIAKKLGILNRKPTMENKIKISKGRLKKIIKEAIDRQKYLNAALYDMPPSNMHPEDRKQLLTYRLEWKKLQKRALDEKDPMHQGPSSFKISDVGTDYEHKSIDQLKDSREMRLGIQKRMDYLLDKMIDILVEDEGWYSDQDETFKDYKYRIDQEENELEAEELGGMSNDFEDEFEQPMPKRSGMGRRNESSIKITRGQLRKIIMEETENLAYELDKVGVDDILAAEHPSDVEAEDVTGGDIFNQVDHAAAAGAEPTTRGIESMPITELRRIIRNALTEFRHWKHSPTMEEEQEMWDEGEMGYDEMLAAMDLAQKSEDYQQWTEPITGKHRSQVKKKKRKPKSQSWRAKAQRDPRQTKMF